MREVAVIGVGMIPFGRRDEDSLMDMLAYASLKALDDAGMGDQIGRCGLRRQHGRRHHPAPDGDRQLAGRPAEPAARRGGHRRKRPGFGRLGGQEWIAGGGLGLLRHGAGGGRRENARGDRLARHRLCGDDDPSPGGVRLRRHPARHGGHVHPPVHGEVRRHARAARGGGDQEPGDGRPQPLRARRDGNHQRGHLRRSRLHRQQPGDR